MPSTGGFQLVAGRIPGERIQTSTITADTATITTTETEVGTITAALVSGRKYRVVMDFGFTVSVATDHHFARIREDNSAGTQIQGRRLTGATTAQTYYGRLETEYTAVSTGNKTFSATFVRTAGTGNIKLSANANSPTLIYVDYISG